MQRKNRFRPGLIIIVIVLTFLMIGNAVYADTLRIGNENPWKYGKFLGVYFNTFYGSSAPGKTIPNVIDISSKSVVITADKLNVRRGPGLNYQKFASVTGGTELKYVKESSGWYNVMLPDGRTGWVSVDFAEIKNNSQTPNLPSNEDSNTETGDKSTKQATVKGTVANVRSGPDTTYEVVTKVRAGTKVEIIKETTEWYKIRIPEGQEGWIAAFLLEVIEEPPSETTKPSVPDNPPGSEQDTQDSENGEKIQQALVKGDLVNVRSGPDTTYEVVTKVSEGTKVEVIKETADWYKIRTPQGQEGWIAAFLLEIIIEEPPSGNDEPEVPDDKQNNGGQDENSSVVGDEEYQKAVVLGDVVNVRLGPDTTYPVVAKVSEGEIVTIKGQIPEWYKIVTEEGKEGWIASFLLRVQKTSPSRDGTNDRPENPTEQDPSGENSPDSTDGSSNGSTEPTDQEQDNNKSGTEEDKELILKEITTKSGQDSEKVTIKTDGAITYTVNVLSNPDRLVFDLNNVAKGDIADVIEGMDIWVSSIRIGQFTTEPLTLRVVLDLKKPVSYSVAFSDDEKTMTIEVKEPSLDNKVIVVDPGHGGYDPGAIGVTGLKEKDFNLDTAKRLKTMLEAMGAEVIITRSDDEFISLTDRADKANLIKADLFISIHANSSDNPETNGTCTYYYAPNNDSELYAQFGVRSRLAAEVQKQLAANLTTKDLGTRQANFSVLRNTEIPSILVESAFLSNKADEALLRESAFREKVAESVAQGVLKYFILQ